MNKIISNLHLEILNNERQQLLQKLIPFTKEFVLAGGTALALQINHRKSFDFDFFSTTTFPKNLLEKLSKKIEIGNTSVDTTEELTFTGKNGIKITFLYYPFTSYFAILQTESGLRLFPVQEIALQKAYTIGRRGEYRDVYDLYAIIKNKYIELPELIRLTKKVYGGIFDERLFLQQLVYFDDMLDFRIIPISGGQIYQPQEIKSFFELLVKNYISLP